MTTCRYLHKHIYYKNCKHRLCPFTCQSLSCTCSEICCFFFMKSLVKELGLSVLSSATTRGGSNVASRIANVLSSTAINYCFGKSHE